MLKGLVFTFFCFLYLDLIKDNAVLLKVIALMPFYQPVNIAVELILQNIFFLIALNTSS